MALDGTTLYTMDANDTLRVIDVSSGAMVLNGSVTLPYGGNRIFVANGVAYVGAESVSTAGGYLTVDVSNPSNPKLIEGPDNRGIAGAALALNGSGLGVSVQEGLTPSGQTVNAFDVFDASTPDNTGQLITQIERPARPYDVAIGSGIAFVAAGTAGLQVVNYATIDTSGVGPTITVLQEPGGNAPGTSSISMTEGATATFLVSVTDPGQIRNVAVLLNGQTVLNDVSYPFDLSAVLPSIAANGSNQVTLAVQATDTAGNVATTDPITVTLLPDTTPPVLLSESITNDLVHSQALRSFTFVFSKPIDSSTVTDSSFMLTGLARYQQEATDRRAPGARRRSQTGSVLPGAVQRRRAGPAAALLRAAEPAALCRVTPPGRLRAQAVQGDGQQVARAAAPAPPARAPSRRCRESLASLAGAV